MITKLVIDNFKAIEHLELDLRPFQVFVGPNDSGKSTILQALDLLGRSTPLAITPAPDDSAFGVFDDRASGVSRTASSDTCRTAMSLER